MNKDKFRKIIGKYYEEFLHRDVDDTGLSYYYKLMEKDNLELHDIKIHIKNSLEAKGQKTKQFLKFAPKFESKYSKEEIEKLFQTNDSWYHSFEINGVSNKGIRTSLEYQMWAAQAIPIDLTGKTVLDLGAADGFYSYLCESRGAKKVVSLDFMEWKGHSIIKKILNSNVEFRISKVQDIDSINENFDIILFFGLYYHLEDPVQALRKIFGKANETVFLAGHIINHPEPLMCYYNEFEMHPDDDSNWWAATPSCLIDIGKRIGFSRSEFVGNLIQKIDFQPEHIRTGIRSLGNLGLFKFSK